MDSIIYREGLENLYNGNLYKGKDDRVYVISHINIGNVSLYSSSGYDNDNDPYDSISYVIKTSAFKDMLKNGEFTWIASSLMDPWIREGDCLVINGEEEYVQDVIGITGCIVTTTNCYDWFELDVIVNNSPKKLQKSLLQQRSVLND